MQRKLYFRESVKIGNKNNKKSYSKDKSGCWLFIDF